MRQLFSKKSVRVCLLAVLLLVFLAAAHPWYVNYIKNDHIETCDKARFCLILAMWTAKEENNGENLTEEEALETVNRELQTEFGVTISDFGEPVSGICREGGTWTILYDEESGHLKTFCTAEGHEETSDWD